MTIVGEMEKPSQRSRLRGAVYADSSVTAVEMLSAKCPPEERARDRLTSLMKKKKKKSRKNLVHEISHFPTRYSTGGACNSSAYRKIIYK